MPFDNSKAFLVSKDQVSQGFRPCSFTNKSKKQGRFYILGVRIKLDSLLNSTFFPLLLVGGGVTTKVRRPGKIAPLDFESTSVSQGQALDPNDCFP